MSRLLDITGNKYHCLTAIKFHERRKEHTYWVFTCVCGKFTIKDRVKVMAGQLKSCGCKAHSSKHGLSRPGHPYYKFYITWALMLQRCYNPNHPRYKDYGGRGIKVEWPNFLEFLHDMFLSFKEHNALYGGRQTTVDRINNDGNYSRTNCKWSTAKEQMLNTRRNKK